MKPAFTGDFLQYSGHRHAEDQWDENHTIKERKGKNPKDHIPSDKRDNIGEREKFEGVQMRDILPPTEDQHLDKDNDDHRKARCLKNHPCRHV